MLKCTTRRRSCATTRNTYSTWKRIVGLTDGDAQFEQLTMDVGRAPQRVVAAHLPDQLADFAGDRRSTWFAAAHFPGPEQPKALAMPRDDGLRPDDGQRRAPVLPNTRQDDP